MSSSNKNGLCGKQEHWCPLIRRAVHECTNTTSGDLPLFDFAGDGAREAYIEKDGRRPLIDAEGAVKTTIPRGLVSIPRGNAKVGSCFSYTADKMAS